MPSRCLKSPVGTLFLKDGDTGLEQLLFARKDVPDGEPSELLDSVGNALEAYWTGDFGAFRDIPLAPKGTAFELAVWRELLKIPAGSTRSYGQIAATVGGSPRAVGTANGRNPLAIIIPCHRVIGADGSLTGYGGGLERKEWLLAHEGALAARLPFS